ncbi:hypothetical protein LEMLEM_LOCUS21171 [Lemmus lemmus]
MGPLCARVVGGVGGLDRRLLGGRGGRRVPPSTGTSCGPESRVRCRALERPLFARRGTGSACLGGGGRAAEPPTPRARELGSLGAGPFVRDLRALSDLTKAPASRYRAEHDPAPATLPSASHRSTWTRQLRKLYYGDSGEVRSGNFHEPHGR